MAAVRGSAPPLVSPEPDVDQVKPCGMAKAARRPQIQKGRGNRHALSVFSEWIKRSLGCLLGSVSSLVGRCSSVSGLVSRSSSSVSSLVGSRGSSVSSSVGSRSSSVSSLRSSIGSRVSSGFSVSHCRVSGLGGSVFGLFRAGRDGQSSSGSSGSENDLAHVIAILEQRVEYARRQLRRTQSLPRGANFARTNNRHSNTMQACSRSG